MAPDILKTGKPVCFGGTDPVLTQLGNPWLFRFRPNDSFSARVIAEHGVNGLGKKKWAIIHSTDAFGTSGSKATDRCSGQAGATIVLDRVIPTRARTSRRWCWRSASPGADVIGSYFSFDNDIGIFGRQLRQLGVTAPWVGSASITSITALKLAGPALYGTYGVTDLCRGGERRRSHLRQSLSRSDQDCKPDIQSSWTYDAVTVLANSDQCGGPNGAWRAIRDALLAVARPRGR